MIPSDPDQPEAEHEAEVLQDQEPSPLDVGPVGRMVLAELVPSDIVALHSRMRHPSETSFYESPRSRERRVASATLEQEMGLGSVAEAMRPIRDRAVASMSSTRGPVTKQMVAEACDTLVREKHPASPPEWPEYMGALAHVNQSWKGETETLRESPPPRRKTVSTPRPER